MKSVTRACGALSLLCLAAALSAPALGAVITVDKTFSVTVTLTPVCTLSTPSALTLDYTDKGSATSNSTAFTATCTQGVAYDLSLASTSMTVAGLPVTLKIQDTGNSNADVTTTVIAGSSAGSYRVLGSIIAGQTGICDSATADTVTATNTCATTAVNNTLTLTY